MRNCFNHMYCRDIINSGHKIVWLLWKNLTITIAVFIKVERKLLDIIGKQSIQVGNDIMFQVWGKLQKIFFCQQFSNKYIDSLLKFTFK